MAGSVYDQSIYDCFFIKLPNLYVYFIYIYSYIYVYIYVCVCIYVYIYAYFLIRVLYDLSLYLMHAMYIFCVYFSVCISERVAFSR